MTEAQTPGGGAASPESIPLPPREYQRLVCGPARDLEAHFERVGKDLASWLRQAELVGPGLSMLDIGCGCGRVARHLVGEPGLRYTGFDRHPGMIAWCRAEIGARFPNFDFEHVDVASAYDARDGHRGSVDATDLEFPYPDERFDTVLMASVLSHMPLEEARSYLRECRRTLRAGGRILGSVIVLEPDHHDPDLDFRYVPEEFWDVVSEVGLESVDGQRTDAWVPAEEGADQRWFCLRRPGAGSR